MKKKIFLLALLMTLAVSAFSQNTQGTQPSQNSQNTQTLQVRIRNSTPGVIVKIYTIENDSEPVFYTVNISTPGEYKKQKKELEKLSKNNKSNTLLYNDLLKPETKIALKADSVYTIILVDEESNQYVKEGIKVNPANPNVVVEFKKNNRRNGYLEEYNQNQARIQQQKEMDRTIILLMTGFTTVLLLLFLIGVLCALAGGGKANLSRKLVGDDSSKKRVAEMIGALLMIVPVVITMGTYHFLDERTIFWFFKVKVEKEVSISVSLITMLSACLMYFVYVIRYGIFKIDSFLQIIFSIFQTLVNCWALAGICSMFLGEEVWNIPFMSVSISSKTFFIMVIGLSVLGARSIAGFSWILLIIVGISRLTEVDSAMGIYGAIYIVFMFMGLLLQFVGILRGEDFRNDFIGFARKGRDRIAGDVSASAKVTKKAVKTAASVAMTAAGGFPPTAVGTEEVAPAERIESDSEKE